MKRGEPNATPTPLKGSNTYSIFIQTNSESAIITVEPSQETIPTDVYRQTTDSKPRAPQYPDQGLNPKNEAFSQEHARGLFP
jgi:hypothetical protein